MTAAERIAAQDAFLASFATSANVTASCRVARIARSTLYEWSEHDEAFSIRYKQAGLEADDVLRAAIFDRAVSGVDKPLHYQGRMVIDPRTKKPVTVKEYSDTLLIFLAKARMPEFRERAQVDVHATLNVTVLAALATEKLAAYLATATAADVVGEPDGGGAGG